MDLTSLAPILQLGGLLDSLVGQLFAVVVVVGLVVIVGRIVLKIAWRLVTIAAVVLGAILLFTFFFGGI